MMIAGQGREGTMRRAALALLCSAVILTGGCLLLLDDGILYEETWWDTDTTEWGVGDSALATQSVESGRYYVLLKQKTSLRCLNTEEGPFDNAQIDLDVKHEAGTTNLSAGGLLFRGAGLESMYLFEVCPAGSYRVGKWIGNAWTSLVAWTNSTAVNTGGAENHVTVIMDGSSLTFLINGTEVSQITGASLLAGYVGVVVTSFSDDEDIVESFDNLVVREL
jgi:hypothetical protein